jgi:hypothetical protein
MVFAWGGDLDWSHSSDPDVIASRIAAGTYANSINPSDNMIKTMSMTTMSYTPTVEKATMNLNSTIANGKVILTGTLTKDGLAGLEVILQYDKSKLTFDNIAFDAGANVTNFSTNVEGRLTFGSMDQIKTARIKVGTPYKLTFTTKETITNPSYHPALANGHSMYYQEFCTIENNHEFEGKDMVPYRYPNCLTGEAWDVYANNPYDLSTRKEFLNTSFLNCIDKKKNTKMTSSPYALALENVTTDVGPISRHGQRKIDARHYNGFLFTPGIVYHMTSKIQNSLLNNHYGNPFEVSIINFIT